MKVDRKNVADQLEQPKMLVDWLAGDENEQFSVTASWELGNL